MSNLPEKISSWFTKKEKEALCLKYYSCEHCGGKVTSQHGYLTTDALYNGGRAYCSLTCLKGTRALPKKEEKKPVEDPKKISEETIKKFLTQMATQDNRATAFPYFYTILDREEVMAPLNNCDAVRYHWQDGDYDSLAEVKADCEANNFTEEETQNALDNEVEEYGVKETWVNKHMFLTETDAKEHLRLNHYHYSNKARTYIQHAWRAPELEGFLKSLFKYFGVNKGNLDFIEKETSSENRNTPST